MTAKNPRDAVVVAAVRTPVTKAKRGALKDTRPDDLLTLAIQGALAKAPGFNPADLTDVIVGTAMPEGEQGMNVARISALAAGVPYTVPAMTINRFCSSGLQSLAQAAAAINAGWSDAAISAGVESMSQIPMGGDRPSPNPGIMDKNPEIYTPMGITSENVASRFGVSRADQDAFAASSHAKAAAALAAGKFVEETVPVHTRLFKDGKWEEITVTADDGVRADTTAEGLSKLKPAFSTTGTTTAGNSSQVSDGAAATLVLSNQEP